jgi:hypothetical protein
MLRRRRVHLHLLAVAVRERVLRPGPRVMGHGLGGLARLRRVRVGGLGRRVGDVVRLSIGAEEGRVAWRRGVVEDGSGGGKAMDGRQAWRPFMGIDSGLTRGDVSYESVFAKGETYQSWGGTGARRARRTRNRHLQAARTRKAGSPATR